MLKKFNSKTNHIFTFEYTEIIKSFGKKQLSRKKIHRTLLSEKFFPPALEGGEQSIDEN